MAEKKFNEDLCEQVRQGKLAIENTDADRIIELMKYIFPRDAFFDTDSKFYYSEGHTKSNYWISDDFTDLPTRPVQDFFVPVSTPLQESPELEREAREWHDADYWMREYEILRRVMNMRDAVFEIVQMARIEYEKNMDL